MLLVKSCKFVLFLCNVKLHQLVIFSNMQPTNADEMGVF